MIITPAEAATLAHALQQLAQRTIRTCTFITSEEIATAVRLVKRSDELYAWVKTEQEKAP